MAAIPCKKVTIPSGIVECTDVGHGDTLILLHGIGSSAQSFFELSGLLSKHYRVIAWNAPGYGESNTLPSPKPSTRDYAASLLQLIAALDIERPLIFGHSLGALIAASLAFLSPEAVKGLVLADPAQGYGKASATQRHKKLKARLDAFDELGPAQFAARRAVGLLSKAATDDQRCLVRKIMAQVNPVGYRQAAHMLAAGDLAGELVTWQSPTLVMCGSEDTITPPVDARALAAKLPNAQYFEIAGVGHAGYIEQPGAFADAIRIFAAGVSPPTNRQGQ